MEKCIDVFISRKHFYEEIGINISHYIGVTISLILSLMKWSERDPNVKPQTFVETFDQANSNSIPRGGSRGGCRGCGGGGGGGGRGGPPPPPPPPPEMTCSFLIQLVFCQKKLCGLLVLKQSKRRVQPPPKKNPGSAPDPRVYMSRLSQA